MKISEIIKIKELEKEGALLPSKVAREKTETLINKHYAILEVICYTVSKRGDSSKYLNAKFLQKLSLRLWGVKELSYNKEKDTYYINTKYGKTEFYTARKLFENEVYPSYLAVRQSFKNCINYAVNHEKDIEIVVGVKTILNQTETRAVLQIDDMVVDFNYSLIMNADLYYKLTNFQILNRVSSQRIKQDYEKIEKYRKSLNNDRDNDWLILFAYEDFMENFKKDNTITSN